MIAGKALPDSRYTPVDQITGGTPIVFQNRSKKRKKRMIKEMIMRKIMLKLENKTL
jgi:hypothetical protein